MDTEFISERSFRPDLALVQVATPDTLALVDAQAVPDLAGIWELAADPAIVTVMHAGDQEARFCWQATGAMPANAFDVQMAAGFAGERFPLSYSNLALAVLRVRLKQGQTRSDWARRPLAPAQLDYAAEDVHYLLPLWERLARRLEQLQRREWLESEYAERCLMLEEEMTKPRWWRLSGTQGMSRRELAAVREVYLWREAVASRRNLPRKRVLRDDLIVAAALTSPLSADGLRRVRGLERYPERDFAAVVDALERARDLPAGELPEKPPPRGRAAAHARMLALLLEAVLESTCAEQRIDSSLLGSASDVRDLIRWHLNGRDAAAPPALLRGWRATICGDVLESALQGEVSVYVSNARSRHPLSIRRNDA